MSEEKYLGLDVGNPDDWAAIIDAYVLVERDSRVATGEEGSDEINLHRHLQEVVDEQPQPVKDLLEAFSYRPEPEARGFAAYAAKVMIAHHPDFAVDLIELLSQDQAASVRYELVDACNEIFGAPSTWEIAEHLDGRQLVRIVRAEKAAKEREEREEPEEVHLDSRRLEEGSDPDRKYGDYLVRLDDTEAVESSPFRPALEGLRDFGFTKVIIGHAIKEETPSPRMSLEDDPNKWWVDAYKEFPNTERMVADNLGGNLKVFAGIMPDGSRQLQFEFGAGDGEEFETRDLNEMIWGYLEVMHQSLTKSWEGRHLPIADDNPA